MVMSLSMRKAMLTTNAKASGRRLTVTVIKDLDADRAGWLKEVVLKSQLLGQYDTIQTKWVPKEILREKRTNQRHRNVL